MIRASRTIRFTLLALLVTTAAPAARAAVFQPTTTADTFDGVCDADCSLRDAVVAANATPGSDLIPLQPGVYTLSIVGAEEDLGATGDLDVAAGEDLKILGTGAGEVVLDGGGIDRVLDVKGSLALHGVTVRNGFTSGSYASGGGILNSGSLAVFDSVITGNTASGFGFGGGIFSDGLQTELTIRNSSITGNTSAGGGGGVTVGGELTVLRTTISGNSSQEDFGGGVYLFSEARASFSQVTITGNSAAIAGGGIYIESPLFPDTPSFRNTVITGNSAPFQPDCGGAGCPAS